VNRAATYAFAVPQDVAHYDRQSKETSITITELNAPLSLSPCRTRHFHSVPPTRYAITGSFTPEFTSEPQQIFNFGCFWQ
jgi:hypothetical protein